MNMFVKKNAKIDVEVYAWENEQNEMEATHDKSLIPENITNAETVVFTFRKPNYLDSTNILKKSKVQQDGELDVANFQDVVLRILLIDWNLKDDNGEPVPIRSGQALNTLEPTVARAACAACLEKINLF